MTFRRFQPLTLRIWHWLNAVVVLLLLGTVFLRDTFLNSRKNSHLIQSGLSEQGVSLTPEQLKPVVVALRNQMWDWHYYLGFVLTGLLLFRFLMGKREVFPRPKADFLKGRHYGGVKILYGIFYLVISFMVVSGLTIYFSKELGLGKNFTEELHEIHEVLQWFFIGFISLHVLGIVWAEVRSEPGLISSMIHGKRSEDDALK